MPVPHHSIFYRPNALPNANQQCQSTEGNYGCVHKVEHSNPGSTAEITGFHHSCDAYERLVQREFVTKLTNYRCHFWHQFVTATLMVLSVL